MPYRAITSAGKTAFSMWLLVSQMFPPVLLIIPIFVFMLKLGLVNTYASLIITYATFALPFSTWMLKAYFDTVPIDLEDAAKVDGCNQIQALTKIILPLAAPGIVTVALFIFILAWHEYMFALTLTSTTEMRTLPVGISLFPRRIPHVVGLLNGRLRRGHHTCRHFLCLLAALHRPGVDLGSRERLIYWWIRYQQR